MPTISVCIPTYNRKIYLREALESVFRQTFTDFEILVLDDGSTDGTNAMIKDLKKDIHYYWQPNRGEGVAKEKLVHLANCDHICFLDDDDLLINDALERLYAAVQADPEPVVAYGDYLRIDKEGNVYGKSRKKLYSGNITSELFQNTIVHSVGSIFPRESLLSEGIIDTSLKVSSDYKMELMISLKHRFVALDKPTFMRRRHDSNISQICFANRLTEYNVLKDFYYNLGGKDVIPEDVAMKRLAKEAYRASRSALDEGQKEKARSLLKESWQMHPTFKTLLHQMKMILA